MLMARKTITMALAVLFISSVSFAADWPNFRGPDRDGKSAETGLLKKWPPMARS